MIRTPATPNGGRRKYSVLWLYGTYNHFTDFHTRIMGETTGPAPLAISSVWPTGTKATAARAVVRRGFGGSYAPGLKVQVRRKVPGGREVVLQTVTTNSRGEVKLTINRFLKPKTRYRLVVPRQGSWGYAQGTHYLTPKR